MTSVIARESELTRTSAEQAVGQEVSGMIDHLYQILPDGNALAINVGLQIIEAVRTHAMSGSLREMVRPLEIKARSLPNGVSPERFQDVLIEALHDQRQDPIAIEREALPAVTYYPMRGIEGVYLRKETTTRRGQQHTLTALTGRRMMEVDQNPVLSQRMHAARAAQARG